MLRVFWGISEEDHEDHQEVRGRQFTLVVWSLAKEMDGKEPDVLEQGNVR